MAAWLLHKKVDVAAVDTATGDTALHKAGREKSFAIYKVRPFLSPFLSPYVSRYLAPIKTFSFVAIYKVRPLSAHPAPLSSLSSPCFYLLNCRH